jgi:hypothetical protein
MNYEFSDIVVKPVNYGCDIIVKPVMLLYLWDDDAEFCGFLFILYIIVNLDAGPK